MNLAKNGLLKQTLVRPSKSILPVAKCEGSPPRTAMVGEVEAASIVEEGGVTVTVFMFATSLTGIGVSGVNVLLTPGGGAKHTKVSLTCKLPTKQWSNNQGILIKHQHTKVSRLKWRYMCNYKSRLGPRE